MCGHLQTLINVCNHASMTRKTMDFWSEHIQPCFARFTCLGWRASACPCNTCKLALLHSLPAFFIFSLSPFRLCPAKEIATSYGLHQHKLDQLFWQVSTVSSVSVWHDCLLLSYCKGCQQVNLRTACLARKEAHTCVPTVTCSPPVPFASIYIESCKVRVCTLRVHAGAR